MRTWRHGPVEVATRKASAKDTDLVEVRRGRSACCGRVEQGPLDGPGPARGELRVVLRGLHVSMRGLHEWLYPATDAQADRCEDDDGPGRWKKPSTLVPQHSTHSPTRRRISSRSWSRIESWTAQRKGARCSSKSRGIRFWNRSTGRGSGRCIAEVSTTWHQFILYTAEYVAFCQRYSSAATSTTARATRRRRSARPAPEATFIEFTDRYREVFEVDLRPTGSIPAACDRIAAS